MSDRPQVLADTPSQRVVMMLGPQSQFPPSRAVTAAAAEPNLETLDRLVNQHATVLALLLAAVFIVGDYLTTIEITFTLMYVVPVWIAAWYRGRALGVAIATLCVAGALAGELAARMAHGWPLHPFRMLWNHGGSLSLFCLVVVLVVRIRAYVDEEARKRRLTLEQLRQAERLGVVGTLGAGLAHELGTPLNVILGHAELIHSEHTTPAMIHASSRAIVGQAQKMTSIIRGLLDFARRPTTTRASVPVAELARDAANLIRPMARKANVEIRVDEAPGDAPTVRANRTELEQVLVNLMMNGIQAMPSGGTLVVRSGTVAAAPSNAFVEVVDTGVGIAPDTLPQVFDPFFTTKEVGAGTGLGLSVSYGIVADHGGQIEVETEVGAGTRFSVILPVSPPA